MTIDVQSTLNAIKAGIVSLAQTTLANYIPQVKADAQNIADAIKSNIETWTNQVTSGELSKDDLKFLLQGSADLVKIESLTQAGIAADQLDQFKQGVINVIVDTIFKAI